MQQISRRAALTGSARIGLSVASLSMLGGCAPEAAIRLGINGGQQPLFRNVAARRDEVLKPLGHTANYSIYGNETEVRQAFKNNQVDVIATLLPQAATIHREDVPIQVFGSIAWVADTLPILVYTGADPQSIKDLTGRTLAVIDANDPGFAYWRAFALGNDNLRLDSQAKLVGKPTDLLTSMVTNPTVDAIVANASEVNLFSQVGVFRSLGNLGGEWKRLSPSSKPLMFGVLVARRQWINDRKTFINNYLKVTSDAMDGYKNDRDGFIRRITTVTPQGFPALTADVATATSAYLGMDDVGSDRVAITDADIADATKFFDLLAKSGAIGGPVENPAAMFYKR